ncbi:universal stress protein [Chitinibacter sp. GC72]|uniref:universal stress protein n=1 Tax=Chitinibacter sp. GC72 TaxID=1526917 RepID=UPI0012F88675|nr:universal stress protein [Chitinibacter sp. GC72]
MYQHILVPLDQGDTAAAAFEHALEMAALCNARLYLVHVLDIAPAVMAAGALPGLDYPGYGVARETQAAASREFLEAYAARAKACDLACETRLIEQWGGDPARTLLSAATDCHADLIVMGTHGYSGFMHLIFGSVAESLLHHTTIPVLLVRKNDDDDDDE